MLTSTTRRAFAASKQRTTNLTWLTLPAVLMLAAGCGSEHARPPQPATSSVQAAPQCPMAMMKDAQLAATDGEHDVSISFTTAGDPTALRTHVRQMGAKHDRMAHGGGMMSGAGHGGMPGMHGSSTMVPSHAVVDDIDHGARIVLTPDDPTQLASLSEHVHAHVAMMQRGHCPMMEHHAADR